MLWAELVKALATALGAGGFLSTLVLLFRKTDPVPVEKAEAVKVQEAVKDSGVEAIWRELFEAEQRRNDRRFSLLQLALMYAYELRAMVPTPPGPPPWPPGLDPTNHYRKDAHDGPTDHT